MVEGAAASSIDAILKALDDELRQDWCDLTCEVIDFPLREFVDEIMVKDTETERFDETIHEVL